MCPAILKIWREESSRGRYQAKWAAWRGILDEMVEDEEMLSKDEEFHNSFEEVDLKVIAKHNYEIQIE